MAPCQGERKAGRVEAVLIFVAEPVAAMPLGGENGAICVASAFDTGLLPPCSTPTSNPEGESSNRLPTAHAAFEITDKGAFLAFHSSSNQNSRNIMISCSCRGWNSVRGWMDRGLHSQLTAIELGADGVRDVGVDQYSLRPPFSPVKKYIYHFSCGSPQW